MSEPTKTPSRTILVAAAVPVVRRSGEHASADPSNRGMSWITGRPRIIEILRDALDSPNTQLQLDGSKRTIRIRLDSVRIGATRSLSGAIALECRPEVGDFVQEPWSVGCRATIWFADSTGIYSFQVKVIGGTRVSLMVNQPACVVRYCRRTERRYLVPGGELPRVALPLTDGTWWEGTGVRDLSTSGMRLSLPDDLEFPLGRATRLGLGLHPQRFLELTAVARHVAAEPQGRTILYGLEFEEPSSVARIAISRFTARLTEDAQQDDSYGLPSLPPSVAFQLKTARHDGLNASAPVGPARTAPQPAGPVPTHVILHR